MSDETALQADITKALEKRGHLVIRIFTGSHRVARGYVHGAPEGTPDLCVLVRGGRTVWMEVKLPGQKLSPEQKLWHERAWKLDHVPYVARSVAAALEAIGES